MIFDKLRAMRERCGLTVTEISNRSGVPEATVKRIFGGKTGDPQFQTIVALVHAMGGSLDEMMLEGIINDTPKNADMTEQIDEGIKYDTPEDSEMNEYISEGIKHDTPEPEDNEAMQLAIEALERANEARIQDLKESRAETIRNKDETIHLLMRLLVIMGVVLFAVLAALIAYFVWDFSHPNIGLIQY